MRSVAITCILVYVYATQLYMYQIGLCRWIFVRTMSVTSGTCKTSGARAHIHCLCLYFTKTRLYKTVLAFMVSLIIHACSCSGNMYGSLIAMFRFLIIKCLTAWFACSSVDSITCDCHRTDTRIPSPASIAPASSQRILSRFQRQQA